MTIRIPYFTRRSEAKRVDDLKRMRNSPLITIGDFTLVNPVYRGPNPYRGPELTDPRNAGKDFIFVRGVKKTAPQSAMSNSRSRNIGKHADFGPANK